MYTFLKQYITYSVGITLNRLAALLLLPLYTRFFSSADYGKLDTLMTLMALCQPFLMLGIDSAVQLLYFTTKGKRGQDHLVMTSILLVAVVAGLCSLLAAFFAPAIVWMLFADIDHVTDLRLLCLDMFAVSLLTLFRDNLRLRQKPLIYNVLAITQLLLMTGLNIYFVAVQHAGIHGFISGLVLADLTVMFIAGIIAFLNHASYPALQCGLALIKLGLPLLPVSTAYWVLSSSDRFFLLKFSTLDEIGLYGIANRLAAGIGIFAVAVQLAWRPYALRIQTQPEARLLYATAPVYYLAGVGWLGLGVASISPLVLKLFTAPTYAYAARLLPFLILAQIMYGGYYIVSTGVEITRRPQHLTWTILIAALVNVGLNFLLIPTWGADGAAIATVAAYTIATFCVGLISYRLFPLPYNFRQLIGVLITLAVAYTLVTLMFSLIQTYAILFTLSTTLGASLILALLLKSQLRQIVNRVQMIMGKTHLSTSNLLR